MALYDRTCNQCGAGFRGGPRAWYCPECRAVRKKVHKAQYLQRIKAGTARRLGSEDLCAVCGQPYTVNSGLQKYCPKCAPEAVAALDRQQGMEYYKTNKERINPVRNARRRKMSICVICGKIFPAAGTCTNTCSPECRTLKRRQLNRKYDTKRSPRKRIKK